MRAASRWMVVWALGAQGCAIIALVGENRDAGFEAATADVPAAPPDQGASPVDAPALPDAAPPAMDAPAVTDAGPPAMDVAFVTDVPFVTDARVVDRPGVPGVGLDVVDVAPGEDAAEDVVARADASATAEAGMVMVKDGAALEDAQQVLPDVVGASCRRDIDCTRDPAGPLCNLMTMRCGMSR